MVLELAANGRADAIVTVNIRHFLPAAWTFVSPLLTKKLKALCSELESASSERPSSSTEPAHPEAKIAARRMDLRMPTRIASDVPRRSMRKDERFPGCPHPF